MKDRIDQLVNQLEQEVDPLLDPQIYSQLRSRYFTVYGSEFMSLPRSDTPTDLRIRSQLAKFLDSDDMVLRFSGVSEYNSQKRSIDIAKYYTGWMRTLALAHETTHYLAGHNFASNNLTNRADAETVAESVAGTTLRCLGIDAYEYSHYKVAYVIATERSALTSNKRQVIAFNKPQIVRLARRLIAIVQS